MSVESSSTSAVDDLPDDRGRICTAPSCWAPATVVEIADSDEEPPVLCESCRKQYLGVSS